MRRAFSPSRAALSPGVRRLARDERGVTIVEFAMIAGPLSVLLLGSLDTAHSLYMRAVLQGQLQKAARDGSLESASGSDAAIRDGIDERFRSQVRLLNKNAEVTLTRRFYRTFSKASAAQQEPFVDTNDDKTCNGPIGGTPAERFTDTNSNGVWDRDGGGAAGGAGAKDIVVYTASVTYPSLFPVKSLFGGSPTKLFTARTVLANQPYGEQADDLPTEKDCA